MHPGRWNSRGNPALYVAQSRALALLESLVHAAPGARPANLKLVSLRLPDGRGIGRISERALPAGWDRPVPLPSTQTIGDTFLREGKRLALRVPSALVRGEFNLLINPRHSDARFIEIISIEDFPIDPRLTQG